MKKIFTILVTACFYTVLIMPAISIAQAPEKMSYQTVIRNTSGNLVVNQSVGIQISILQTSPTGTAVYVETHNATSNSNGLVSIQIGGGNASSGTISGIDWSSGPYYVKTETDPTGGTNYTISGTSELLSVPYALFAGNVTPGNWVSNGTDISNANSGNVGIGTVAPSTAKLVISGNPASEGLDLASTDQYANLRVLRNSLSTIDNDMHIGFGSGSVSTLHLYSDNNESVTITGGKVGIGTTSPGYIMDAVGTGGPRLRIFSQDGIFAGLLAKNNTHEYFIGAQADYESASGINSGFHIYDNTVGAQRMVIDADGNMGIGNYAPVAKLDVAGTVKIADGTQSNGRVLTSDNNGLASWQKIGASAYGLVQGTIAYSSYGIVSVSHPSTGIYVITCNNLPGNASVMCTLWDNQTYGFITYYQSGTNDIEVRTRNAAGADVDLTFSIVVFNPF